MNVRNVIGPLLILLLGTAGCADGRRPGILSLAPPTASRATIEDLAAGKRDCLQYPIAKFADGSEDWNADWVFFTLVRSSDSQLVRNAKGEPNYGLTFYALRKDGLTGGATLRNEAKMSLHDGKEARHVALQGLYKD